jgi:S-adenosylmethionine decarboxylase
VPKLPKKHAARGWQSILDLRGCEPERLSNVREVRRILVDTVIAVGGTVVRTLFHRFKPWGVSGVVVIAESHLAIHTWPEHGYAAVDIFTCSPALRHDEIRRRLKAAFHARQAISRRVLRSGRLMAGQKPAVGRKAKIEVGCRGKGNHENPA